MRNANDWNYEPDLEYVDIHTLYIIGLADDCGFDEFDLQKLVSDYEGRDWWD